MAWILVMENEGSGQSRLRDRPLARATMQDSTTNQASGKATCFMGHPRAEDYAVPEQEAGQGAERGSLGLCRR